MHWLILFLSAACMAIGFASERMGVAIGCVVLGLVFLVTGSLMMVARRIESRASEQSNPLSDAEVMAIAAGVMKKKQAEEEANAKAAADEATDDLDDWDEDQSSSW